MARDISLIFDHGGGRSEEIGKMIIQENETDGVSVKVLAYSDRSDIWKEIADGAGSFKVFRKEG